MRLQSAPLACQVAKSLGHSLLMKVADDDQIREEIDRLRNELDRILGIQSFAKTGPIAKRLRRKMSAAARAKISAAARARWKKVKARGGKSL